MSKLFAIPFGTDGTDGDSSYHLASLPCDRKDTFASLKAKLEAATKDQSSEFAGLVGDPEDDPDPEGDALSQLAGFWIIDEKAKEALENCDGGEIGSDSALYRHIRTLKQMASKLAIKTVLKLNG